MKKVDEKHGDEKHGDEKHGDQKSEAKASTRSESLRASVNGMSSNLEDVRAPKEHSDNRTASDVPAPMQPKKNRERNDSWDDLGDEAPGSRIRLY
jgi:hypothetical protein